MSACHVCSQCSLRVQIRGDGSHGNTVASAVRTGCLSVLRNRRSSWIAATTPCPRPATTWVATRSRQPRSRPANLTTMMAILTRTRPVNLTMDMANLTTVNLTRTRTATGTTTLPSMGLCSTPTQTIGGCSSSWLSRSELRRLLEPGTSCPERCHVQSCDVYWMREQVAQNAVTLRAATSIGCGNKLARTQNVVVLLPLSGGARAAQKLSLLWVVSMLGSLLSSYWLSRTRP